MGEADDASLRNQTTHSQLFVLQSFQPANQDARPVMRCLSTERVHLSALCTPPQPDHHTRPLHDVHKDSAITDDSRLTSVPLTSSTPTAPSPIANMYSASQGPSSVGLAMKPTRSDSALTQSDHRRLPDFHQLDTALTSSLGTQWPAVSLPALGGSIEGSQRKPLSRGFTSTCSLGGSSGSDSSRTSTAKNPYSSGSSLSTVPDDTPSWEVSKASHTATSKTAPCTAGEVQDSSAAQGGVSTSEGGVSLMVPVPPTARPPPHASTGCQPHVSGPTRGDSPPGVVLPERYRHVLRKSGSYSNVGGFGSKVGGGQDLTSREKDLGSALAWIRHEMVSESVAVYRRRLVGWLLNFLTTCQCVSGTDRPGSASSRISD